MPATDRPSRRKSLLPVRGESALPSAWPRILLATVIALVVTIEKHGLRLDTYTLTATPFTILGVSISFFLGFRNNTAYNRFWEARTLWGKIINTSRSLAGQVLTQTATPDAHETRPRRTNAAAVPRTTPDAPEKNRSGTPDTASRPQMDKTEFVHALIGFAHALRHHLRDTDPWPAMENYFSANTLGWLKMQSNVPLAITYLLRERIGQAHRRGDISEADFLPIEASITALVDAQGGCERIKNTPIPITYTVLSHRIVSFFCYALPFGLIDSTRTLTPVVVLLVSYAFFGLDTLGEEISDPFGTDPHDLPLPTFAAAIETNLREMLRQPPPSSAPPRSLLPLETERAET